MKIIFFTNSRKFSPRTFPAIRYAQETIPQHLVSFQLALKTSANLATILPSSFYILFSILEPRPVASDTEMLALLLQLLNTTGCICCHIYSHVVVLHMLILLPSIYPNNSRVLLHSLRVQLFWILCLHTCCIPTRCLVHTFGSCLV